MKKKACLLLAGGVIAVLALAHFTGQSSTGKAAGEPASKANAADTEAIKEATELGLLEKVVEVVKAILSGQPGTAERLANNAALAVVAKKAAKARIKAMKR